MPLFFFLLISLLFLIVYLESTAGRADEALYPAYCLMETIKRPST